MQGMLSGGPVFWRGWCLSHTLSPVDVTAGISAGEPQQPGNCWWPERHIALGRVGVNPPRPRPLPLPLDLRGRLGGALSLNAMSGATSGCASCFTCETPAFSRGPEGFVLVMCLCPCSSITFVGEGGCVGGSCTWWEVIAGSAVNAVGMYGCFRTSSLAAKRLESEKCKSNISRHLYICISLPVGWNIGAAQ